MVTCSVYKCPNRTGKTNTQQITFHKFPNNESIKKLWIVALRRENFVPSIYSAVCSVHFADECFEKYYAVKRLKAGSVPSIFPSYPPHLQKKLTSRKKPTPRTSIILKKETKRLHEDEAEEIEQPCTSEPKLLIDSSTSQDVSRQQSPTEELLKKKITEVETKCSKMDIKIKTLQQSKRRLTKKNAFLKNVIRDLKRSKLLSEDEVCQTKTINDSMADIETEDISLETELDDEYFQIDFNRSKTNPFKCSHCEKRFNKQYALARHLRIHIDEKQFKCVHCALAFGYKTTLTRHLRTHTGEKPHECVHCKKRFTEKYLLARHLQMHSSEKPYVCHHCGKSFSYQSALTRHLLRHAGKKEVNTTNAKSDLENNTP